MIDRRWANLLLRVSFGLIFLFSGMMKVFFYVRVPVEKILPFLGPDYGSIILGAVEIIIGLLLVIGLFTRYAALGATGLLVVFVISGLILGLFQQAGLIKDIVLVFASLMLVADGARKWSLDEKFF
ncbi:MAG TPA: DoxX family protein [Candidatus Nanoarchaeia archaeon]|nr:DoxX family protein [Candidatus Nanoarchaeia archaeon]